MVVTETLGVAALSPPAVRDVLAERSFRLVSSGALSQPPNDPTTRLKELCDRLAGASFGALQQWSESVFRQAQPRPTGSCPSRTPIPARSASPQASIGSCSPATEGLAITDEASPLALLSTHLI
jgi:hypothetical protein